MSSPSLGLQNSVKFGLLYCSVVGSGRWAITLRRGGARQPGTFMTLSDSVPRRHITSRPCICCTYFLPTILWSSYLGRIGCENIRGAYTVPGRLLAMRIRWGPGFLPIFLINHLRTLFIPPGSNGVVHTCTIMLYPLQSETQVPIAAQSSINIAQRFYKAYGVLQSFCKLPMGHDLSNLAKDHP